VSKIRVLIVDDSMVIRRILSDALSADPSIEVVGTAANGKIALGKLDQLRPDLVTLDIEMPEMDGLETLTEIRKRLPRLPVIMFSTLTQRGAEATLDALARGASDYVTKPANVGSVHAAIQSVQAELIPRIKLFCLGASALVKPALARGDSRPGGTSGLAPVAKDSHAVRAARYDALVIGASTGGPNALAKVLPLLPANFPMPVLVTQHMPPVFTAQLADRLNHACALTVREAREGDLVGPGGVWIAPGDYHMTLRRAGTQLQVALNQNAPENSCRPAVDVMFRSAVDLFGPNLLAVILTGMGQDGMRGCEVVRRAGGRVIAQDQATSVVWGMPGAVTNAGLANHVVPLESVAQEIAIHAKTGRLARTSTPIGVA
jgi:two-component system chemotaxis response regulator CheB